MNEIREKLQRLSDAQRVLLYHDLVGQLGVSSSQSIQELVLVYEKASTVDPEDLRKIASSRLAEHERPTRFIETSELPRTPHGKLDRRGLPGLIRVEHRATADTTSVDIVSDDTVASAIAAFMRVLGAASVGPDSNFFELGGHSLLAVACILEIEKRAGKRVTITQFLNHPTPRGIAAILSRQSQQSLDYVYPVSKDLTGLPVFVFSSSRLAYALKRDRADWTVYGVQLRWRNDRDEEINYKSLEEMATAVVREVKELGGSGDFVLVGSSFPGMLAFEVAKQLLAAGDTPTLTVLIEPSLWYSLRTRLELGLAAEGRLREGDNHFLRWLAANHPLGANFWRKLHRASPLGRDARTTYVGSPDSREQHAAYEQARTKALWRSYKPSPYAGPAVLLAGSEQSWQIRRNWQKWLPGDCPIHTVNSDHSGILRDPFMSEAVVPILTSEVDSHLQ